MPSAFFTSSVADQVIDELNSADLTLAEFLIALGILVVGIAMGRLAGRLTGRWFRQSPTVPEVIALDVASGVRWLIYFIAIGSALSIVGVDLAWFGLAAIVVLVVAILILRPQMENLAAGIVLTVRPAFTLGDVIEVDRRTGSVVAIGSHSTAIDTVDGTRFHIPNSALLGQTLTVYSARPARRTEFRLSIAPHTPVDEAVSVIADALAQAPIIVSDPAPTVIASGIDANAVVLTVIIWFPSGMVSGEPAIDAAVRATYAALEDAGVELDMLNVTIVGPTPGPTTGEGG